MKIKLTTILVILSMVLGMALGAAIFHSCQNIPDPVVVKEFQTITETIPDQVSQRELIKVTKENEELRKRLKELKAKPKIIIKKETVVKGAEYEKQNIPSHFIYTNGDGLVVAKHSIQDQNFKAEVYDIKVQSKDIISEDKTGNTIVHSETKVSTSYDDKEITIISEPTILKQKEGPRIAFEPLVQIGVAADLTELATPGLHLNTAAYAGVSFNTRKATIWAGAGIDISNRTGPMPSAQVQVRF